MSEKELLNLLPKLIEREEYLTAACLLRQIDELKRFSKS